MGMSSSIETSSSGIGPSGMRPSGEGATSTTEDICTADELINMKGTEPSTWEDTGKGVAETLVRLAGSECVC